MVTVLFLLRFSKLWGINSSVLALPPSHTRDPKENHFGLVSIHWRYL